MFGTNSDNQTEQLRGTAISSRTASTSEGVFRRLDDAFAALHERLGGLPRPAEAADIWADLWHQEAHNSTAIEGNTLALPEVALLLDEGRTAGGKPLAEYLEVQGYGDAAKWVYGQALEPDGWSTGDLLSLQEVRHVHHLCMTPLWTVSPHPHVLPGEGPGNFRQDEIAAFPGGMRPPSWTEVDHLMRDWVAAANALGDDRSEPLPEALARIHNEFERVHPFLDGNGRVGRLLLNLMLGRLGYPPAIIYKRHRQRYLNAMRRSDQGDHGPLGELIARSVTDNLHRFVLPAIAGPKELVPLVALAGDVLSENALRVAATRGRLRAVKGADGRWRSCAQWVEQYRQSRYQRS